MLPAQYADAQGNMPGKWYNSDDCKSVYPVNGFQFITRMLQQTSFVCKSSLGWVLPFPAEAKHFGGKVYD
jgi:hypothetical protein